MVSVETEKIDNALQKILSQSNDCFDTDFIVEVGGVETTVWVEVGERLYVSWTIPEDIIDPTGKILPDDLPTTESIDHPYVTTGDDRINEVPTSAERLGGTVRSGSDQIRDCVNAVTVDKPNQFTVMSVFVEKNTLYCEMWTSNLIQRYLPPKYTD